MGIFEGEKRMRTTRLTAAALLALAASGAAVVRGPKASASAALGYKLLATNKTGTMQKELNEAASAGFRFEGVMGGETAFGGREIVSILGRAENGASYEYKLLATNKTSTMEKEMSGAADSGYEFRGETVAQTMFGGREVVVIMERPRGEPDARFAYRLLATNKTSTMQKELTEAAESGFAFRAVSLGSTAFGGQELVVITEKPIRH
jgi:hypothetical protein